MTAMHRFASGVIVPQLSAAPYEPYETNSASDTPVAREMVNFRRDR
jgi:hypothetical protein